MTEENKLFAKTVTRQRWRCFVSTLLIYFSCLTVVGIVSYWALSTLLCFLAPSNRCPSIMLDGLFALRMWSVPAFVAASLTALAAYFCRRLIWWHAFILMPLAIILLEMVSKWKGHAHLNAPVDLVIFLVVWGVMMMGAQVAWLVTKPMYAVDHKVGESW